MNMVKLGKEIPLVMLNFTLSEKAVEKGLLPKLVQERKPETALDAAMRTGCVSTGIRIIDPTEKVCVKHFVDSLEIAGYVLVKAWFQERQKRINARLDKRIWIVRYEFALRQPGGFVSAWDCSACLNELEGSFCKDVTWRVDAFLNPYFENGNAVEDKGTISIDLDSREANGKPNDFLYVYEESGSLYPCKVD